MSFLPGFGLFLVMSFAPVVPASASYDDLLKLFEDWRVFQNPKLVDGVPDYTAAAMAVQKRELASYQARLAAIDPRGWPIPLQVDYHMVRAEMNGLDFDHRVLKPWANNPAFYVTVFAEESDQPLREGPFAYGSVELWQMDLAQVEAGLAPVPSLLDQARQNLVGNQKDIWVYGTKSIEEQSAALADFAAKISASQV